MRNTKGFTLIELMIVLVIIAILATIAFPAYQESVRKSRRVDAKSSLLETSQILERCYTEFNAYNNATCPVINAGPPVTVNRVSTDGYYTIVSNPGVETLTNNTYTLTATPNALGGQNLDARCATFTLDHTGVKTATNTDCW